MTKLEWLNKVYRETIWNLRVRQFTEAVVTLKRGQELSQEEYPISEAVAKVDDSLYNYANIMGIYDTYSESSSNISFVNGEKEAKVIFRSEVNNKHEKSKVTASLSSSGDIEYQKVFLDQSEPNFKLTKNKGKLVVTIDRVSYAFFDEDLRRHIQFEQASCGDITRIFADANNKDFVDSVKVTNASGSSSFQVGSNPFPTSDLGNFVKIFCEDTPESEEACSILATYNTNRIANTINRLMSTVYVPAIQNGLKGISSGLQKDKGRLLLKERA